MTESEKQGGERRDVRATERSAVDAMRPRKTLWRTFREILFRNQLTTFGTILTILTLLMAAFAPLLATHDPLRTNARQRLQPPSAEHWMGTDDAGRDIYSRAIHGSRVSVRVGYAVVALTTLFGLIIGVAAGFYKRLDGILMRTMDGLMAFPSIFLAIAILAALGADENNVIWALTVTLTPSTARIVRGVVLSIKEFDYVSAARSLGARDVRLMVRHVIPNSMAPLIVQSTFVLGVAILSEAGLSFVGVGTQPPTPSWGNMLSDAKRYLFVAPWMSYFPGMFIVFAVLGLNLLGDGLRDAFDPRMRNK